MPENLVSRDGFSRPVPRQSAHLHTQAESRGWCLCLVCVPSAVAKFSGNFKAAVKTDSTFGQPDPVQKFSKKGQDGAVQNCCPKVDDPKVTFVDSVRSGIFVSCFWTAKNKKWPNNPISSVLLLYEYVLYVV